MLKMRIVAISESINTITIQTATKRRDWEQMTLPFSEFKIYMSTYFPKYYRFYEMAMEQQETYYYAAEWFYNFGETEEMRRKGESFIFVNYDYRVYTK